MGTKCIKHQSLELSWNELIKVENPKTLVLGSFNPFENSNKIVDYYYGRESNHFWRSIAIIQGLDELHYFDKNKGIGRKIETMNNSFICFDVIDSINVSCQDIKELNKYIECNIFNNFLDSKIWTSKTKSCKEETVNLKRNYNQNLIEFLTKNNSINKIIHTMGVNRLSLQNINPKEKQLGKNGFEGFMNQILDICRVKNIEFIFDSLSPSDYAIKSGKVNRSQLQYFLKSNIPFPETKF